MKWLLHLLEAFRPLFEADGKLKSLKPLFMATDRFFFSSPAATRGAPHVRDPLDVKRFMSMVIIGLLPCLLCSLYFFGLRVLAMIAVSYAVGGAIEVMFAIIRKEEINEGFLVTGLIFPLILPPTTPLWMVAAGIAFGVVVGKELFGGTGRNLFNPALVGRCFLLLSYPAAMSKSWIMPGSGLWGRLTQYVKIAEVDAISCATPLAMAKEGDPAPLWNLFTGHVSGSVGETSALAVILGGMFLVATRVANWRTVVAVLGSYIVLGGLLHALFPEMFGPVIWHVMAGSLLFGAVFMATDPVTSPATDGAKWAFGILIGVMTLMIRNIGGYAEGVMFAILMGNIFAPILDEVVIRRRLRRLNLER